MATSQISGVIQHLRKTILLRDGAALTDGQLLTDYISHRDEAALAALVHRHGPMVWGVCRRVLRNYHDVEDAFQATFLVFVRKVATMAPRELVANWLYGVAHKTALKARANATKRKAREGQVTQIEPAVTEQDQWRDLQPLLDEELSRLPDRYRAVIVLCDLESKTRKEVAHQLGCPEGTVAGRLSRARRMLAKRLARRGAVLSSGALVAVLSQTMASAGVPLPVVSSTIKAASLFAAGQTAATGVISAEIVAVTEGVIKAMFLNKLMKVMMVLLPVLSVLTFGAGLCLWPGGEAMVSAQTPEVQQRVQGKLELKRLQGVWVPHLLMTVAGAEPYPLAGRALYLDGHQFSRIEGKRIIATGSFKVEDGYLKLTVKTRNPWDLEAGEIRDSTQYAYKVEDDLLTLCYSSENKGKAGDLTPGAGRQVVVYRRQGGMGQRVGDLPDQGKQ